MKEQIDTLVKLQKIELETCAVNAMLNRVSEKIKQLDDRVKSCEQIVADESALLDSLRKKYRSHESDTEMNLETMKKGQDRLSSVKTNKEYHALLKGIEEIKKKNLKIEEDMLALLGEIEETEKNVNLKKEEYNQIKIKVEKEKEAVRQEAQSGEDRLMKLNGDKNGVADNVSPELMERFLQVKKQVTGPAIVPVKDLICDGCNMNIPPQTYNELHRFESLKFCPFCNRIIYIENS